MSNFCPRRLFVIVAPFLVPLLAAGSATAQPANEVSLHAAFLSAPTEWCPAEKGVPVLLSADGPEVHASANFQQSAIVRIRRGGVGTEEVEVSPLEIDELRSGRGVERVSTTRLYPRVEEAEPLGRLSATFRICETFWSKEITSGVWTITAPDGTVVRSGETSRKYMWGAEHPLLNLLGRFPKAAQLGDETILILAEPLIHKTTETIGSPTEEQER